jgi:phosphoheptose isomerase|tara:strand:- start:58 stop:675 length:618 start_codon:yes stop_codon:yes gene_type:complete
MRHIDFENIEEKFDEVLATPEWQQFVKDFKSSSDIYIVANGGLWAVGNHAADDCTRLFAKAGIQKHISTIESQCLMTSIANDYGYNNLFIRWLELARKTGKMKDDAMIVALSCSGGSKNVVSCCHWAEKYGYKTAMIAGQDRNVLSDTINNVVLNCKYFHTVEVLTLILFYDLIHACGAECPSIKDEVVRKGTTQPLARNPLNGG